MSLTQSVKFTPSNYQSAIFNEIVNGKRNIVAEASPGSGKTTTLVEASKLIPNGKSSIFAAFNTAIVKELSLRLPENIKCATLHSIGLTALMSHFRTNFKISEYKSLKFIDEVLKQRISDEKIDDKDLLALKFNMRDAINLARLTQTKLNEEDLFKMCCRFSVELLKQDLLDVIKVMGLLDIYNRSFSKTHNQLDFVDMIYLPISNPKIRVPQYDYVMCDEIQDFNASMHLFVDRLVAPGGRTISCGDPFQSIYSFMGSDIESFRRFQQRPNTVTLPLSISYRCAKNIVELARTIYPSIEPNPTNEPGEFRTGKIEEMQDGDMVLCRNNRPLFYLYFELLLQEKRPLLVGKNIQDGLTALIAKCIKKDVESGIEYLNERLDELEVDLKERGIKKPKENQKWQDLYDKVKTIDIVSRRFETMKEVNAEIIEMFKEKDKCIKLMTIHGSKGLEADRVFIIERFEGKRLLPSPYAQQEWEHVQEKNLRFVMTTRAKKSLIFIPNLESK